MDSESPRLRLSILGIVVFSLFTVLFARLWYLQVMSPDQAEISSTNNRRRTIQEEAPRGRIFDAKGRLLVDNRTSLVVTVDKNSAGGDKREGEKADARQARVDQELLQLAQQLTKFGTPTKLADIQRRLDDPQYNPLQPVPVASDVSEDLMVLLAERADDFPGVQVERETVRAYPQGTLAAHVLGYVGRISKTDYAARMGTAEDPKTPPKPYQPDSNIGKTGVETSMEDDLRGTPGEKVVEVDAQGRVTNVVSERKPIPGNDLQLTIDIDVQKVTEQKLADQLESMRGSRTKDGKKAEAKAGSSVVIDPRNGNVVAMASYPTYDPAQFVNGISADAYERLKGGDPELNPTINRAVAGLYAPGSTFKLVTGTAALQSGLIAPGDNYDDSGVYQLIGSKGPGAQKHNAEFTHNGTINITKAITASSDVFFYRIGDLFYHQAQQYGDAIQNTARQYGFGQLSGIQLPDELAGVIPDEAWKHQYFDSQPEEWRNQNKDQRPWYGGDAANLAVGQGSLLVTPLQLANAYATFAGGGVRHQPNLVLRALSANTDAADPALQPCAPDADLATAHCIVRTAQPVVASSFDLPPGVHDPIFDGLRGVPVSGTAAEPFRGFDLDAYPLLGKTGTVETGTRADNSVFVGVGRADDPQFVVMAYLEHVGFGAEGGAPVVRKIFELLSGQDQDACAPADPNAPSTATTTKPGDPPVCPPATTTTTGGSGGHGATPTTKATTPTTTAATTPTTSSRSSPTTRATTPTSKAATNTAPTPTTRASPTTTQGTG